MARRLVVVLGLALAACPAPRGTVSASASTNREDGVLLEWVPSKGLKVLGWRVRRDGAPLVALPASATSYDDTDAAAGALGPPRELTASQGTSPDGVVLAWQPAVTVRGSTHLYEVIGDVDERAHASTIVTGERAAPTVERYELTRDDTGDWVDAGAGTTFTDAAAPVGTVVVTAFVSVTPDPPRQGVMLRVRGPRLDVQGATSVRYRLRAVSGSRRSAAVEAVGHRQAVNDVAQLHIGWQRSIGDSVFTFAELPVSGQDALDDTVLPGVARFYRPSFRLPGVALAGGPATRVAGRPVTTLWAGLDSACAVDDGAVGVCWGSDEGGKRSSMPTTLSYRAVVTGEAHGCGLGTDERVSCWGADDYGQAPPGPSTDFFTTLAAAGAHTCGLLTSGEARCWGDDSWGQATAPAGTFTAVATAQYSSCAVTTAGRVQCWGSSWGAPLDDGYVAVTLHDHGCARKADGQVSCWGPNTNGQATPPPLERFTSIAAGDGFTCGVRDDSVMRCWGLAPAGTPADGFASVAAGRRHACGLKMDGSVQCWGDNTQGQAPQRPPTATLTGLSASGGVTCALDASHRAKCFGALSEPPPTDLLTQVRAGRTYACGLRRDGTGVCWGNPPTLEQPPGADLAELAPGADHACALRRDRSLVCWGLNDNGQATPPVNLDGGYVAVTSGPGFSCAVRDDGSPECWGDGSFGVTTPPVGLDAPLTSVGAGTSLACGLRANGHGICWGQPGFDTVAFEREVFSSLVVGDDFVCGQGAGGVKCFEGWYSPNVSPPSVPQRYLELAAGGDYACALKDDHQLVCWGAWANGAAPRP